MADQEKPKKKRKEIEVFDDRSNTYKVYAANPAEATMSEEFSENFGSMSLRADIAKARKAKGFQRK